jgi:nucleotide-binding universal stress UspA family protein
VSIVVGVDGSEQSLRALRFALDEARLRGCRVRAVSAWHVPALAYEAGFGPASLDFGSFEEIARQGLARSLEQAGAASSGVEVVEVVREGQPADVLLDEAKGAGLLVVGSRGLGGFRGLLLGSVGQQCAHHASCPVVIVHASFPRGTSVGGPKRLCGEVARF